METPQHHQQQQQQDKGAEKAEIKSLIITSYPGAFLRDHELDTTGLSDIPFGRAMMKELGLRQDTIFLNHGSYGTVPKRVLKLQHDYDEEREEHPDMFFRLCARQYLDKARQAVAAFINAQVDNLMIVSNATTALNLLVKSFPFKSGDAILDTEQTYGAIKCLTSDFTSRLRPDVERIHLEIKFPIQSEDEIVSKYEEILDKHKNIKVAIIDHITSPTSVVLPVARLIKVCHSRDVLVFVDGAHTIGQLPLDMEQLQADAYTSNMHKWTFSPRGAAFVWFSEKHRSWINPPNSSWQIKEPLPLQFFDQGTRDHVPMICSRHGLQFYEAVGGIEKVIGYTSKLAKDAQKMLCETCGLEPIAMPESMEAPNMKLVKLPTFPKFAVTEDNTWLLQRELYGNTNIFGTVNAIQNSFYIRFSVHIYNEMEDFKQLAAILKPFLEKNTKE